VLLKEYQFKAYDRPIPKRGMMPKCQDQINASIVSRDKLFKEKLVPYDNRIPKGFQNEKRTDEKIDSLIGCMDRYIAFKRECLENHKKCYEDIRHRKKTDIELVPIEDELGDIVRKMTNEVFRAWFAGYTGYYKNELISAGSAAFWDKLTNFNTEFSFPFSYYTTVIKRVMFEFIKEYHAYKGSTMSLGIFEEIDSA